tara:strand:+ start:84 stop:605 length:522 start_codon:yes stop_codon:yes gene_type:complete
MRILVLFFLSLLFLSVSEKDRNKKRVAKQIKTIFNIENFELSNIKIDNKVKEEIWDQFNYSKFKKIIHNGELIGYSYESKAPSMHYEFDYLIILGLDLKIIDSKVLVYRENWGGEIGSKRWLKQFKHKGKDDRLKYMQDISAISGATISVKSMIETVNLFLESVNKLNKNSVL